MPVRPFASSLTALSVIIAFGLNGATASAQDAAANPNQTVKELRTQCVADARAKGLKGPPLRSAVSDCIVKARPDLASVMECRKEGMAKNLTGAAMKEFVQKCRRDKSPKGAATAPAPAPAGQGGAEPQ